MSIQALARGVFLALLFLAVAAAADINGKWKAEFQTPDGQTRTTTFTFKVDGGTLTGTVGSPRGESKIEEGRVNGDDVTFTVVRNFGGDDIKFLYKGKVAGDEIKFNVEAGERNFEMTAKRM
jgi:hypothetical protein